MNMLNLIDTHCHLAHGRLRQQTEDVLARARQAGVTRIVCAAADIDESKAALDLAHRQAGVFCAAGLHPHDAKDAGQDYLRTIEALAADPKNVAVGEIGLDYHRDLSPRPAQRRVFAEQLELADRLGKPIVIHTRQALDDTIAILAESRADAGRAVFHSFTEGPDAARRVLSLGATISFSGIVTFAKADDLRRTAAAVPDDRILIETDSPFLSPVPVRKMKTNEPANVRHVAAFLAQLRRTPLEDFANLTTANAENFFQIPPPRL